MFLSRVSKQTSCPVLLAAYPGETMAEEHHDPIESWRTDTGELQQPTKPEGMRRITIATLVQLPTSKLTQISQAACTKNYNFLVRTLKRADTRLYNSFTLYVWSYTLMLVRSFTASFDLRTSAFMRASRELGNSWLQKIQKELPQDTVMWIHYLYLL